MIPGEIFGISGIPASPCKNVRTLSGSCWNPASSHGWVYGCYVFIPRSQSKKAWQFEKSQRSPWPRRCLEPCGATRETETSRSAAAMNEPTTGCWWMLVDVESQFEACPLVSIDVFMSFPVRWTLQRDCKGASQYRVSLT